MASREVNVNLKVEDLVDVKAIVDKLCAERDAAVARAKQAEQRAEIAEGVAAMAASDRDEALANEMAADDRARAAEQAVTRVRELADICPVPDDDERGRAGWRFAIEHMIAVLDEVAPALDGPAATEGSK